ncbi:MAG: cytochrome P450 [Aliidongia sp.]
MVGQISKPLSTRLLLGEFLNVAEQDQPIFLDYLRSIPLLDAVRPGGPKPQAFLDAWQAGVDYCREAIARARREKSEDLIGLIAAAHDDAGTLSDDEMMAMMVVLFSGGISTVGAAITASLLNLAQNPEIADRLRADPSLAGPVLEESIRLASPVMLVMRFATTDVEIGGLVIPGGMPVYTMIAAASRDPAASPEPRRFDIDRPNLKDHVAFGHGIHTCIGNAITRATVPIVVEAVTKRFPGLRPAESGAGPSWETTPRSRHIGALPLSF